RVEAADVAAHDGHAVDALERVAEIETVEDGDAMAALDEERDEDRPDVSGAAGDEDVHGALSLDSLDARSDERGRGELARIVGEIPSVTRRRGWSEACTRSIADAAARRVGEKGARDGDDDDEPTVRTDEHALGAPGAVHASKPSRAGQRARGARPWLF